MTSPGELPTQTTINTLGNILYARFGIGLIALLGTKEAAARAVCADLASARYQVVSWDALAAEYARREALARDPNIVAT